MGMQVKGKRYLRLVLPDFYKRFFKNRKRSKSYWDRKALGIKRLLETPGLAKKARSWGYNDPAHYLDVRLSIIWEIEHDR